VELLIVFDEDWDDKKVERVLEGLVVMRANGHLQTDAFDSKSHQRAIDSQRATQAVKEVGLMSGWGQLSADVTTVKKALAFRLLTEVGPIAVTPPRERRTISLPNMAPNAHSDRPDVCGCPWPLGAGDPPKVGTPLNDVEQCVLALIHLDPRLVYLRQRSRLRLLTKMLDPTFDHRRVGRAIKRLENLNMSGGIGTHAFARTCESVPNEDAAVRVMDALACYCGWQRSTASPHPHWWPQAMRLLGHEISHTVKRSD
jgi:hypothetical protein